MKPRRPLRLPFEMGFSILVVAVLALATKTAFAQRGGGGHMGGGHFGSGSFGEHGGAFSSHSKSARSHSKPSDDSRRPVVGAGTSHSALARALSESDRSGSSETSIAPIFSDSPPAHTTIGFPDDASSIIFRSASLKLAPSGPLSFTGEGHRIWQNSTSPSAGVTGFAARPFADWSAATWPRRPHGIHAPRFFGPYYPVTYFPLFGFNWGCDPFDSSIFGCNDLGYGCGPGYGYGFGGYDSPGWDSSAPNDSNSSPDELGPAAWQTQPADDNGDSEAPTPDTLIYLNDGSSYEVTDYWLADNKLYYVTNYGGENAVDLNRIDMQRTVDANAGRGVSFTLHPAPPAQLTPPPSEDTAPASPQ